LKLTLLLLIYTFARGSTGRWMELNDACRKRGVENGYFESDPKAGKKEVLRV